MPPAKRQKLENNNAASILASIPSAETGDIATAEKFSFKKRDDASAGGASAMDLTAAPGCFTGLTLVFTGVFPTIDRSVLETFSKNHGAKVTTSISGKTSALVVGDSDVGPSKLAKAKDKGVKIINEQGFLKLIDMMPEGGGSGIDAEKARHKQQQDEIKIREQAEKFKQEKRDKELFEARQREAKEREAAAARAEANYNQQAKSEVEPEVKDEYKDDPMDGSYPATRSSEVHGAGETDLWTSRYAPKELDDICGNPGMVKKLSSWLHNWKKSQRNGFKPGPDGAEFRAAMLHGAPGIGKTTAAHLVANMEGFDVIEYNASDTRSKKLLQEHVYSTLSNTSLAGFMNGKRQDKPICIIMDEVDGMSAGDRGGVGQMAQFARKTDVPLILICNERTLPKMRPFDKICFELAFRRPDAGSLRKRLQSIAISENLQIDGATIDQLVAQTRSDIRQIINLLSTYATSRKSMSSAEGQKFAKSWEKESALKPFDIVQRYLNPATWRDPNIDSKIELYFNDYAFSPLMVQENYLNTVPNRGDPLTQAIKAAESISDGDLVDRFIHGSEQHWNLMPLHAVLSCVKPSFYINGRTKGMLAFSAWLGNNSKAGKYRRLLAELESHVRLRIWAGTRSLRSEYLMDFVELLLQPLKNKGAEGIAQVIEVMDAYYITREDFDVIMELGVGQQTPEQIYKSVPTAVKTAFTRKYNTSSHPVPFMKFVDTKAAARKEPLPDLEGVVADDMEAEPEKEEVTLESEIAKDKYIKAAKAKKPPAKKAATKKAPAKKTAAAKTK